MFKKITMWGILSLLLLSTPKLQAQTLEIENALIGIEFTPNSGQAVPAEFTESAMDTMLFRVSVMVLFSDTSLIDTLHIKVGRTIGGSDVANLSLPFDGINLPSNLCLWLKEDNMLTVCVAPSESNAYHLFLEVWADDKQGNTTAVFSSSVN